MRLVPPLLAAALALTIAGCADETGPGPAAAQSEPAESRQSTQTPTEEESAAGASAPSPTGEQSSPNSATAEEPSPSSTPTDTGKPVDPDAFTSRLEAAVERSPTAHIEIELQADGQMTASANGVQDLAANSLDMSVAMDSQELAYRLVDGEYYLAQPPKWVPVSQDSQNPLIRQTLQQIQILSMRNLLEAFVTGLEAAGVKGRDDVGGTATTHYTATVDSRKALAELGLTVAAGTPDSLLYDIWVDEDDLVRKMTFTQNGTTATMTASEWGEPVTIAAPQDSELAAAPESGTP